MFGFADHAPTTLLTYRTEDIEEQLTGSRIEQPRSVFSGMDDPAFRHVLDSLEHAAGRAGGDATCCNHLLGMGASSSLRGGAALGVALQEHADDLAATLDAWETPGTGGVGAGRRSSEIGIPYARAPT